MPTNNLPSNDWLRIGQIVGGFGLKGQVKVKPLTEFLDRFRKGGRLRLNDDWVTIESISEHKNHLLLKLSGVEDLSAAEKLQWAFLECPATQKPKLEKDEYFTSDLVGLTVFTQDGENLGAVNEVLPSPAHDVLVVGEVMIPAVRQ